MGVPMLRLAMENVWRAGVGSMHLNAWHLPHRIQQVVEACDAPGPVTLHVEQTLLGTSGGIHNALGQHPSAPVLVHNGDVIFCGELGPLVESHLDSGALATLGLIQVDDPTIPRSVAVSGDLQIRGFGLDDREHGWTFSGIHVLSPEIFGHIQAQGCIVADVYRKLLESGRIKGAALEGTWGDLGTIDRFGAMHHDVLGDSKLLKHLRPDLSVESGQEIAMIDPSAHLGPLADLHPPFVIDSNTKIGASVQVGPHCFIGAGAIIAEGAVLERCVVLPGTRIAGKHRDAVCFDLER
jgi:NDP-sugar pyrophosphorylase family protein